MTAASQEKFQHIYIVQRLNGGVGLNLFNGTGYSLTLSFSAEQARGIAHELLKYANELPVIGTPADLGCVSL